MTARDSSTYSMLTSTFLTCIQFSISSRTGIGIGIGVGQYYWVLGVLFGIVLTLPTCNMHLSTFTICLEKRVYNILKFTNVLPLTRTTTCSCRELERALNHILSPVSSAAGRRRNYNTADIWKHGVRPTDLFECN